MKKLNVRTMVQVALLIAIEIVLTRFCSISTTVVRIGFGFVPIAICGMLYGPIWAGLAGGVADVLGATLFPVAPYFPGFTISAVLTGLIFGLLLRREEKTWFRLSLAVALNCLGVSLCLNTLWLSMMFGTPFQVLLPTRILQAMIMIPIQLVLLQLLRRPVRLYMTGTRHA